MYSIKWTKKFDKQLSKLGENNAKQILEYLYKNIDGVENPRSLGKPLKGDLKGKWRYRVGDYRIICEIQDEILVVLGVDVGHRQCVYEG